MKCLYTLRINHTMCHVTHRSCSVVTCGRSVQDITWHQRRSMRSIRLKCIRITKPFIVPSAEPLLLSKKEFCSCSLHKKATPTVKRPRFSSTLIKDHMISKYLGNHHGNQNNVTKQVQDKLQGTMKELSGKEVGVYRHVTIMWPRNFLGGRT